MPEPSPPVVKSVDPPWGYNGEVTTVEVRGSAFYPQVVVDGYEPDAGEVQGDFEVWLDTSPPVELTAVQSLTFELLRAQVPAGLEAGTWPLRVVAPTGLTSTGDVAFVVTNTRADHLELDVDEVAFEVGEYASLNLAVLDPVGAVVPQALQVTLLSDAEPGVVQFKDGGLDEQRVVDGGISGWLGEDGRATVQLTSAVPADISFTVAPLDPESTLRAAEQRLSWEVGKLAAIRVELPGEPYSTAAGTSCTATVTPLDALGNVLEDYTETVFMRESCGDWMASVTLDGATEVTVTPETACPDNQLLAYAIGIDEAESANFAVAAGPVDHYVVSVTSAPMSADDERELVVVEAEDAWGNTAEDANTVLVFRDSAGGLERGLGRVECDGFDAGWQVCTAHLVVAEAAVTLTATDEHGHSGVSNVFLVEAGAPAGLIATVGDTNVVAGEAFPILLRLLDAWGNDVTWDVATPVFEDSTGSIVCDSGRASVDGQVFDCAITIADPGSEVRVEAGGLEALADVITVSNAEIAEITLSGLGASYQAGAPITVSLTASDAWGNPYLVQTDTTVVLTDSTGTWSTPTVELDSDGQAIVSGEITVAGSGRQIMAAHLGNEVGVSSSFTITPGPAASLELVLPPWVEVDVADEVEVVARDLWFNVATDYAGSVEIVADGGRCDPIWLDTFVGGRGQATLTCGSAGLAEELTATDTDALEATAVMDVVDLGCVDGPVAVLELDGGDEVVECLIGGAATVLADVSASIPGSLGLVLTHFDESDGGAIRTLSDSVSFDWDSPGIRRVRALVADSQACASLAEGLVYLGDGAEPAGPVLVEVADSVVTAGGSTTVTVTARDCSQDLSPLRSFTVRADLGVLAATSTGAGLSVTTDATAEGSFGWTFNTGYAGTATVFVGSTAAFGEASVVVESDSARPTVIGVSPEGYIADPVSVITVRFSEDMRPPSSSTSLGRLEDTSGTIVPFTWSWPDTRTLELVPTTTLDAGSGPWLLTLLSGGMRDVDGNRLDGQWTGGATDFYVRFGAVPVDVVDPSACSAALSSFTPDGDDGAGAEADSVAVTTSYPGGAPNEWELVVSDGGGEVVYGTRVNGSDTPVWDGRAFDGRVVAAGGYTVVVYARDSWDNRSEACEVPVSVTFAQDLP